MPRLNYIVQFTHPGGEHTLSRPEKKTGIKQWNYGKHRRKFIATTGACLDHSGRLLTNQELLFWGEWEPTSKVTTIFATSGSGVMPTLVHEPYLVLDPKRIPVVPYYGKTRTSKPSERQNTDPFVFADNFYYCCCKQTRFKQLQQLEKGSIILFGSTILAKQGRPYFVLDTVFVVGDFKCYTPGTYATDLAGFIPPVYDEIMGFKHWANPHQQFVCYKGATYREPINEMFSYAPCRIKDGGVIGFPRVRINSIPLNSIIAGKNIITDNLNSAPKYSLLVSASCSKLIWDEISKQVEGQGYLKGIQFYYKKII